MKNFNFKMLLCSSLMLTLVVACGKDKGGSSAAPAPKPVQNLISMPSGLAAQYQAAFTKLSTWYKAADTQNIGAKGLFYKGAPIQASASFNYCINLIFWKSGDCDQQSSTIPFNKCYVKVGSSYNVHDNASCTGTGKSMTKLTNPELKKALTRTDLKLLEVVEVGAGVFRLTYGVNFTPYVQYIVDTNLHSILNPVVAQDSQSQVIFGGLQVQTSL